MNTVLTKAKLALITEFCKENNVTEFSFSDESGDRLAFRVKPAQEENQEQHSPFVQITAVDEEQQRKEQAQKLKKKWLGK